MTIFWILTGVGLAVSVLSALENRVKWIDAFCAFFGEGCRKTADFTLFTLPISWWGVVYYAALALAGGFVRPAVFWFIMAGFGFELTFLWIMARMRTFCVFCLLNAFVVGALAVTAFEPNRIWSSAAVVLIFFLGSNHLISKENASRISRNGDKNAEAKLDAKGRPALGPKDAAVLVVEFSDLFCPACRKAHETSRKIRDAYGDRIRWVFRDFPLENHEGAATAAEAAHCAGDQGKFWEFQDKVFDAADPPDKTTLKKFADELNIDVEKFTRCLEDNAYLSLIEEDIQTGKEAGITATPTFIINGEMISSAIPFEKFSNIIETELEQSRDIKISRSSE